MHLDAYCRHLERVRVVAACDADPERVRATQERYHIAAGFASLDEMLRQSDFEVGVVCTPTPVRESVIGQLAAAGKHVFVEKPLADSYDEAERMVATCERHGVLFAVDQNFRYHYPFDTARRVLREGALGAVVGVLHNDLMFRQDSGWRTGRARHALSVMGVHWLDGFRWLLDADPVSILCHVRRSSAIRCSGETDAFLQMVFDGGIPVSYVQSFSSPAGNTETRVLGEKGVLLLDYGGGRLYDADHRSEPVRRWDNPYAGAHKPEATFVALDELLRAIAGGGEPSNSGRDNLKTITLLEGAYRSASEGRPITFRGGLLP
jgi:predicted dehydrogenase